MKDRSTNLALFFRCLLRWFVYGPASKPPCRPRSLVIVQQGKLGDMICTTPMFRAVKQYCPETKIIVVGDKINGQVLAGNSDVSEYVAVGTDAIRAIKELKRLRPEAGILTTPSIRALAMLYLAGVPAIVAPRVVGGRSAESRLYTWLRPIAYLIDHRMGHYAPSEYLAMLRPFGIESEDTHKHVAVSAAAVEKAEQLLDGRLGPLVGISPSAGNRIKQWPPERFARVAEHLWRTYKTTAVVLGGPGDSKEIDGMLRALDPAVPVINLGGKLTIEELKAVVGRLALFISVDTGPIYIAEALGVPTVDITGPVDEREQPPRGPRHAVVVPPQRKAPELFVMNPSGYNYDEAKRQVESITAAQVAAAADKLIAARE